MGSALICKWGMFSNVCRRLKMVNTQKKKKNIVHILSLGWYTPLYQRVWYFFCTFFSESVITSSRRLQHRVSHWYQQVGTGQPTCWDLRTEGKYESVPLHGLQETIPRNPSRLTSLIGRLLLDQAVSRRPAAQHSSLLTPLMSTMSQRCTGPCCSQHMPARQTNSEWKHT